jgi:hypothetical protein
VPCGSFTVVVQTPSLPLSKAMAFCCQSVNSPTSKTLVASGAVILNVWFLERFLLFDTTLLFLPELGSLSHGSSGTSRGCLPAHGSTHGVHTARSLIHSHFNQCKVALCRSLVKQKNQRIPGVALPPRSRLAMSSNLTERLLWQVIAETGMGVSFPVFHSSLRGSLLGCCHSTGSSEGPCNSGDCSQGWCVRMLEEWSVVIPAVPDAYGEMGLRIWVFRQKGYVGA